LGPDGRSQAVAKEAIATTERELRTLADKTTEAELKFRVTRQEWDTLRAEVSPKPFLLTPHRFLNRFSVIWDKILGGVRGWL